MSAPTPDEEERARADDLSAALRESGEKCRLLAGVIADMVSLYDRDGRFLYVSPSPFKMTDYTPEETVNQDVPSVIHPHERDRCDFGRVHLFAPPLAAPQAHALLARTPGW